jgi:dTDP-4-dehydrorhamnose 3,5-epimerase
MTFLPTTLQDVWRIIPKKFYDERGHFFESFSLATWEAQGFKERFVQDNQSFSVKGVIRGLHFQENPYAQGKLVRVLQGRVLDVAVDLRPESATFGRYEVFDLDGEEGTMVYIPPGFAHGFAALEDSVFHYKCTHGYKKEAEGGIRWNDESLNIDWGVATPIVSAKDQELPSLEDYLKTLRESNHR